MPLTLKPFSHYSYYTRWGILIALSAMTTLLFSFVKLPGAMLLGPMIAAIIMETNDARIKLPHFLFYIAQGIIGCMVAEALTSDILNTFLQQWPIFLLTIFVIVSFNCILGGVISKLGIMPGTSAIWGLLPGSASAMMLMAESYGADARLVAFMQYLRVVIVALLASIIARMLTHDPAILNKSVPWFVEMHWLAFFETLVVITVGLILGRLSRLPGGMLLVSIGLAALLQGYGVIKIELPRWFLALAYLSLGWYIGMRFTREVLRHALRTLPQTILAISAVVIFCALLGLLLMHILHVDLLTAYLATSPGGLDAIAIIAASTKVNVGIIMALQSTRLLLVILIGPPLSRLVANRAGIKKSNQLE